VCRVSVGRSSLLVALALLGCSKPNPGFDGVSKGRADGGVDGPAIDATTSDSGASPGDTAPAADAEAPPDAAIDGPARVLDAAIDGSGAPDGVPALEAGPGLDGAADGSLDVSPDVGPPSGVYVAADPARGDDANPGTTAAPLRTITQGVKTALARMMTGGGPQQVFVAQGHYPEKVTLVEGISLLGGYQCNAGSCTWARDPATLDTAIDAIDDEGSLAPATVTRKTRLEGFRLRGRTGDATSLQGSVALTIAGGSPTIVANVIEAGNVAGGTGLSTGIDVAALTAPADPGGALIDGNVITAGSALKRSAGIVFDARPGADASALSVATVTNNTIRAGDAPSSYGILASTSGAGTVVRGNRIASGRSPGIGGSSWAIRVSSVMTIDANRINVDRNAVGSCMDAATWCGGIQSLSATITLTNNIVLGPQGPRTVGLSLEQVDRPAGECIVNGNTFDGAGGSLSNVLPGLSAAVALRIGSCGTCELGGFVGRLRNNILLGGTNQLRFGVYEEGAPQRTLHPQVLDNNDFFFSVRPGGGDVLYHLWSGDSATDLTTLDQLNSVPVRSGHPQANLAADPQLDPTLHLIKGSPCIDRGTSSEAPPRDFEGDLRPQGPAVDIGHDEAR
jgi:Protein of unknown function (DUF1565)